MFTQFLIWFLAAAPVLVGRVVDTGGRPITNAMVRLETENGSAIDTITDSRGGFRVDVSGRFRIEIRHPGYRTL